MKVKELKKRLENIDEDAEVVVAPVFRIKLTGRLNQGESSVTTERDTPSKTQLNPVLTAYCVPDIPGDGKPKFVISFDPGAKDEEDVVFTNPFAEEP